MEKDEILDESTVDLEDAAPSEAEMGLLREKTLSGIKWAFFSSFSRRAIGFITTIFLARL